MPWNRHAAKVGEYNAAADAICAELSVPTIDLHGFLSAKGYVFYKKLPPSAFRLLLLRLIRFSFFCIISFLSFLPFILF